MKTNFKRVLALLCDLVVCLSMVACGGGSAPAASGGSGEQAGGDSDYIKVVIAGASDPGNYLPFNATNAVRDSYAIFFYEHLFELFTATELTPVLATGYERISEGVYRVTLHDNIYDYNGEHITSSDVAFCFNKVIENGERTNVHAELKRAEIVDEYTVDLIIEPDALGTFEAAVINTPIVSQKSYEASATGFSSDPVGTGPYYISEWLPGSSITFKKNENYWGKDGVVGFENQNCDEVVVKFIAEPAQVAIEMETGNIDFAYNISSKDADTFVDRPGFSVVNSPFTQVRAVGFNCDASNVFSDIRLRRAVCYAIDPEGILQGVYDGKGGVATCMAIPEPEAGYVLDYVQDWKNELPYPYNIEKAKELMAEAGYPNGGLKVRLMAKDQDEYRSTCEVIQAMLAPIGIEVEIMCYENALYQTYRHDPTAFDLHLCGVANNNIPYLPIGWKWYLGTNPDTGRNVLFMRDEKLQELMDAAVDLDTHNEESMKALHAYMMETAALYPYVFTYNNYVHVDTIVDPVITNGYYFYPHMSTITEDFARHS